LDDEDLFCLYLGKGQNTMTTPTIEQALRELLAPMSGAITEPTWEERVANARAALAAHEAQLLTDERIDDVIEAHECLEDRREVRRLCRAIEAAVRGTK
jgi:hypothetical protein